MTKQIYEGRHIMSGHALRAWRGEIADKRGHEVEISYREAATLLGMSPQGYRNCETHGAPLYVAYACAAILAGLDPYRTKSKVK